MALLTALFLYCGLIGVGYIIGRIHAAAIFADDTAGDDDGRRD